MPRKPAAAKPKTVKWKGLKLALPAEPPKTFIFDLVDLDAEGDNEFILLRMLRSFLGAEQFGVVRAILLGDEAINAKDVGELIDAVLEAYGLSGESTASQGS